MLKVILKSTARHCGLFSQYYGRSKLSGENEDVPSFESFNEILTDGKGFTFYNFLCITRVCVKDVEVSNNDSVM